MNEQQRQAQVEACVMLLKTSWWNLPLQSIDPVTDEFYDHLAIPQTAASLDAVRIPAQALYRFYTRRSFLPMKRRLHINSLYGKYGQGGRVNE